MSRARRLLERATDQNVGGDYRAPRADDLTALADLESAARWMYAMDGAESRPRLLAEGLGRVCFHGERMQAALLAKHDDGPIGNLRMVAVRSRDVLVPFLAQALPDAEEGLFAAGARWCAVLAPPDWLSRGLAPFGYTLAAEIIDYRLRRPCPGVLGNADVLVREAGPADLAAMMAVDQAAFVPLWRYTVGQMAENLAACRQCLVAVGDGMVIGYLLAADQGDHLHVNRVAVHPIWQGRGVGLRLMTTALDAAYRDDVAVVTLNTQADNRASRRLYEQLGFTPTPQRLPFWTHDLSPVNEKDCVTETQPD